MHMCKYTEETIKDARYYNSFCTKYLRYVVLGDIEKLRCRYDARKYHDTISTIFPVWCYSKTDNFYCLHTYVRTYIHHPS